MRKIPIDYKVALKNWKDISKIYYAIVEYLIYIIYTKIDAI